MALKANILRRTLAALLGAGAVACAPSAEVDAPAAPSTATASPPAGVLPLTGGPGDYAGLVAEAQRRPFVLLGENTHGTREFYQHRARITEALVRTGGVSALAIEADWPEVERLNRYVRALSDESVDEALSDLHAFPEWMWRNAEFRELVEQLRAYNLEQPAGRRVGVYGMDVQALYPSIESVQRYLDRTDPPAAARVRAHYRCFTRHGRTMEAYGPASRRPASACQDEARAVLEELGRRALPSERSAAEALFAAAGAAAAVVGAEAYVRAQYAGVLSWNVRDRAMADLVDSIARHGAKLRGEPGQVIVWAHNTHVGDARATDAVRRGEISLGQVMRERRGPEQVFLLGLLTYAGQVMAAREWDRPGFVRELRPALPESWSGALHALGHGDLLLHPPPASLGQPSGPRLERAVGVIYQPATERLSHYFEADLSRQFDAVIYVERTSAVTPLPRPATRPKR